MQIIGIMEKQVVVVEDFNTSRQVIRNTLQSLGLIVFEATDGRDALRYFDGRKIDMVISDYNMPNMNGAELVTYIRGMNEYKYIPIFMLSTDTSIEKQNRAKEAKITCWIKKPFDVTEFKKMVQKALS
jgi:two-component system, chemotaxis family, chemotaxis protein CheY